MELSEGVGVFGIIPSCLQDENMNFNHHRTVLIEQGIKSPSLETLEETTKVFIIPVKKLFS